MSLNFKMIIFFSLLTSFSVSAMPIDWHGVFGADTSIIDNYRRVKSTSTVSTADGSAEVPLASGGKTNASFQSYIFRLQPHVIINDSTSLKSEFSQNSDRTTFAGDSSSTDSPAGFGNALYTQNYSSNSSLNISKLYMELYADTATYIIGRHSAHYGLGALVNAGDKIWDRHHFSRDGMTMKIKLGNFSIDPYWSKIDNGGSLTDATKIKEYGTSLIYDNIERDLGFGILYGNKSNAALNPNSGTRVTTTSTVTLGKTDVKITDLYFKKGFGKFTFELEVPLISGDLGNVYNNDQNTKYNAKAIIMEAKFDLSPATRIGFNAGKVDGDSGSQSSFEAMYLNPNYQVANLLFAYDLRAVQDPSTYSLYNSYITNAMYFKIYADFKSSKWKWTPAFIYAKAEETAKKDSYFHDHLRNKRVFATDTQSSDLGFEIDLDFTYDWNDSLQIGGKAGYLFAGDYFSFTNNPTNKNSADNSYILQLNAAVHF